MKQTVSLLMHNSYYVKENGTQKHVSSLTLCEQQKQSPAG